MTATNADPSDGAICLPDRNEYRHVLTSSFEWRYREQRDVWSEEPALGSAADRLFRFITSKPSHVLDIGTGRGDRLLPLVESGHQVLGLDLLAHRRWSEFEHAGKGRLRFEQANFLDWSWSGSAFDFIMDLGCFHHQHPSEYPLYLEKVAELLRPDGLFALCIYLESNVQAHTGRVELTNHGRVGKYFTCQEICDVLTRSNLKPIMFEEVGRQPPLGAYLLVVARKTGEDCG